MNSMLNLLEEEEKVAPPVQVYKPNSLFGKYNIHLAQSSG